MTTMSIAEIQADLLGFFRRLAAGEKIVVISPALEGEFLEISAQSQPEEITLKEIESVKPSKKHRPFGLCAGEFRVPDDFDAPLPEEIINSFESK